MTTTPILGLTQLEEGQALPEAVVNEADLKLEGFAAFTVIEDRDLATPPGSPTNGQRYLIAASATGAWVGHDGDIAFYINGAWAFFELFEGLGVWIKDENLFLIYDGAAFSAPPLGSSLLATASDLWVGTSTAKAVTPDAIQDAVLPTALTSGTTITPDFNTGLNFSLTLAHNATLANPSNAQVGDSGVITITQDGTGSRTLAYGTNWKFPGGAPALSTASGAIDALVYYVSASGVILCNLTKAYAS